MEQTYAVIVPEGRNAGQQFQVSLNRHLTLVTVPQGARAGDLIRVKINNNISPISLELANVQTNTSIVIQSDLVLPNPIDVSEDLENIAPKHFLCPITECIMTLPVITPSGITYDYFALTEWLNNHNTDPISNSLLHINQVYPNRILYLLIEEFISKEIDKISC